MTARRRLLLILGLVPVSMLRRWWWVIPLVLIARELLGVLLMGTLVPWLWSIVAALQASR